MSELRRIYAPVVMCLEDIGLFPFAVVANGLHKRLQVTEGLCTG